MQNEKTFPVQMTYDIESPDDARKMWANLENLSVIVEKMYSENFFLNDYRVKFQDRSLIRNFNEKCSELFSAFNQLFKADIEKEIKEYEAKIAELKSLIAE